MTEESKGLFLSRIWYKTHFVLLHNIFPMQANSEVLEFILPNPVAELLQGLC